jgi:hypothetical protein
MYRSRCGCLPGFISSNSHGQRRQTNVHQDRLVRHSTEQSVATCSMSDQNENQLFLVIRGWIVAEAGEGVRFRMRDGRWCQAQWFLEHKARKLIFWRCCTVDSVPLHHARKPSPKALVHCAPLITVFATVTPILRWTHAVPLEVYLDAGFLACAT